MARQKGKAAVEKKAQALERLTVEYVGIGDVKPNDYNPNRQSDHDFELLCRSMREDGFTQPIVAQAGTKIIVDGEHRWRAAQALGMDTIPVVFVEMTPEQMRIATLRHNRARGSEDVELASAVLRDLQELGALDWAQDSLMLDDVEMERLLEDVPAPEALAGEEFEPAWEPAPTSEEEVASAETRETRGRDGTQLSAVSLKAIEAAREREKRLAAAKTSEERERVAQEASQMFRLMLLFQGDEATLVKGVLGAQAAVKLIEILEAWVAEHPEDKPEGWEPS